MTQTITLQPGDQVTIICEQSTQPITDPQAITNITHVPATLALSNPPSVQYPAWTVDANVASVSVTDNGGLIPNPNPTISALQPTAIYRINGISTGLGASNGYFMITYTGGVHNLIFTALNDAGQTILTVTKVVVVG